MAKPVKKTNKHDTFTVKDFKMWLLGMTEFQEATWTPNAKQWKAIVEKIELLEDNVQYVQAVQEPIRSIYHGSNQMVQPQQPLQIQQPPHPFFTDTQGGVGEQPPASRFPDAGIDPPDQRTAPRRSTPTGSGIVDTDITKSFI
jgi:hypothetical protein